MWANVNGIFHGTDDSDDTLNQDLSECSTFGLQVKSGPSSVFQQSNPCAQLESPLIFSLVVGPLFRVVGEPIGTWLGHVWPASQSFGR